MSTRPELNKPVAEGAPESPTTARPLEMDDDDVQEPVPDATQQGLEAPVSTDASQISHSQPSEATPPKPPRPATATQNNEGMLKEAFPGVDNAVIKAVLRASGGRVEPAFNALLEMTDPDAVKNEPEDAPPPPPRRPQHDGPELSQVEADEIYARQLAEHYDNVGAYESRTSARRSNRRAGESSSDEAHEHSFIDDDLPVIRENLRKGFLETQTKVSGWITNLRKKIEENFDETDDGPQTQSPPFRRQGEAGRRSGDYDRYDADPQVLSDDFAGIRLAADGATASRPAANAGGLHRPPPPSALHSATSSRRSDGRSVAFKDRHDEINVYDASPVVPPKDSYLATTTGGKTSKWQPLSTVEPSPIGDNDPFSLGDSEDEKDGKDKAKEARAEKSGDVGGSKAGGGGLTGVQDEDEVKKAAAEAMADSLVGPSTDKS